MKASNKATFEYGKTFYGAVVLNPTTLASYAMSLDLWRELLSFHRQLATDEYVEYLDAFYRECVLRFGSHWRYLDITNVLLAASKTLQPRNYLEIGVRRGRSVCTVARGCPDVDIVAFDMWAANYAGMENPGPAFVESQLKGNNHRGKVTFVNGKSHQTVPAFLRENPGMDFDLITVDGDHSEVGAWEDLITVIPRLAPGGILVFDDIAHPAHPYLLGVWRRALARFPFLSGYEFTETGYGVAFAVRRN